MNDDDTSSGGSSVLEFAYAHCWEH